MQWVQKLPRGFTTLIELELFSDIHGVTPGVELSADAPRNKACRMCATEIFLWGLKEWWLRERAKGFLEEKRKDCPEAATCTRHRDDMGKSSHLNLSSSSHYRLVLTAHARECKPC